MTPQVSPGSHAYPDGDSIDYTLGSDAAEAGDAVTISASSGDLVQTDGSNGFTGILGTQTAAGNPDRSSIASGDTVTVQLHGVVRANVSAAVGSAVSAGEKLVPGAGGVLENVDSDADSAADQAAPGDIQAITDEDSDGYALVKLP